MLCCKEGSHSPLRQMQNGLSHLERAGAASESQRDLNAVDAVRYDARCQHALRGVSRPCATARQKGRAVLMKEVRYNTDTNAE